MTKTTTAKAATPKAAAPKPAAVETVAEGEFIADPDKAAVEEAAKDGYEARMATMTADIERKEPKARKA